VALNTSLHKLFSLQLDEAPFYIRLSVSLLFGKVAMRNDDFLDKI